MTHEEKKITAWNNARIVEGYNKDLYRKDACGAWILWNKYGDDTNPYGWEIDHILPVSKGGPDIKANLRAMQHQNNASKGDDYPSYWAVVKAEGVKNVSNERTVKVNQEVRALLDQYYKP